MLSKYILNAQSSLFDRQSFASIYFEFLRILNTNCVVLFCRLQFYANIMLQLMYKFTFSRHISIGKGFNA